MTTNKTPEHKAELAAKRAYAHQERNRKAHMVRALCRTLSPQGSPEWMSLMLAAEVLNDASITQVTRAQRIVRKRYFSGDRK